MGGVVVDHVFHQGHQLLLGGVLAAAAAGGALLGRAAVVVMMLVGMGHAVMGMFMGVDAVVVEMHRDLPFLPGTPGAFCI